MMKPKVTMIALVLVMVAQLAVPALMIIQSETVLEKGTVFKFRTEAIDPVDPFRGRYVVLETAREHTVIPLDSADASMQEKLERHSEDPVYACLHADPEGFAVLDSVAFSEPDAGVDYVQCELRYRFFSDDSDVLRLEYPMTRFYMEESKAPKAEKAYREAARDTSITTYMIVSVYEGQARVSDVCIQGVSLRALVDQVSD